MKKLFAVILLALAITTQSCKKEDDKAVVIQEKPVVEEECKFHDVSNCMLGAAYRQVGKFYRYPCFNPNNVNEFLYVRDESANTQSIHKYNLLTKQNTLILANIPPISQPDWSRTGWIVFSDISWKIWKVRDDGTGLQQISFGQNDQFPSFNPDGDKIIYNANNGKNKMLLIDINGNLIDSICSVRFGNCYNWFISSWLDKDRILRLTATGQGTDGELSYYNYATKQDEAPLYIFKNENNRQFFKDYEAFSPTKVFYSMSDKSLVEYDANTNQHRIIKPHCDNRLYNFFDISPDKTKILAEKETNTFVSNCLYDQRKTIVIMNLDGSNEQEIPLP